MSPNRPYILRALHEWIVDNSMTPYVLVNAEFEDVVVPEQHINDGKIVLNISPGAVRELSLANDYVSFSARFSGAPFHVQIPVQAILAIYAKENGKGMIFPEEDSSADAHAEVEVADVAEKKPVLRVVK